jgi:hypothetical protein
MCNCKKRLVCYSTYRGTYAHKPFLRAKDKKVTERERDSDYDILCRSNFKGKTESFSFSFSFLPFTQMPAAHKHTRTHLGRGRVGGCVCLILGSRTKKRSFAFIHALKVSTNAGREVFSDINERERERK